MNDRHLEHSPERLYRFFQLLPRLVWGPLAELQVIGAHHVPPSGPFLLICNHQSNLDPILIQAVCPRPVHAMAKSTQFAVPGIGALMARLHAFPVRRYRVDPQAVRIALRRLAAEQGVAIYIEGERSWDGHLASPRLGTVRLILKAGVPVIPTTIAGSYEAWPRWHSRIHLQPVSITFGEPMHFPKLDRKVDREATLPDAAAQIMNRLGAQLPTCA